MRSVIVVFFLIANGFVFASVSDTTKRQDSVLTDTGLVLLMDFEPDFLLTPDHYKTRYNEEHLLYKITNNWGNGFDSLYGTRNMRPVLHGLAYRGGANNYYHKENKRDNHNPLPDDGRKNLCQEGFSHSVYLYRENFDSTRTADTCNCVHGASNVMGYSQFDYYDDSHIKEMIRLVYEAATDEKKGPVYLHCWNGWHASGLIAAILLKQFCGYSDWDAVNYWDLGTDGANTSPRYQRIREMIKEFEPYPEYKIEDEYGNKVCPEMPKEIDSSQLHIEIEHLLIVPEAIPVGFDIVLYNVSFGPGKTTFPSPGDNPDIINLLKALEAQPDLQVEIGGYTDNSGSPVKNRELSQQRAKFVYDYLLEQGVAAERLSYKGYGQEKPLHSNKYNSGREGNRRIEVKVTAKYKHSDGRLVDEKSTSHYQGVVSIKDWIDLFPNVEKESMAVIDSLIFEPYSYEVPEKSFDQLTTLVGLLRENPDVKIEVQGHTDKSGMEEQNVELSEKRAESVYNYLLERGVQRSQMVYKGYGSSSPIYSNQYAWGREKNRRIQIKLLE